jgi:hypothetical protein
MNNRPTAKEREHLSRIKELPCSLCDAPGPSEAHHVRQHSQYLCIPLCESCHRGPLMGLHGQKRMWAIQKMDEMDCLNETIRKLQG